MKIVKELPTTGQFIAVWEYAGVIWSETLRYIDGELHVMAEEVSINNDDEVDTRSFKPINFVDWYGHVIKNIQYIVLKDD